MKKPKPRNGDILKSFKREVDLSTRSISSKKKYTRKKKHKEQQ